MQTTTNYGLKMPEGTDIVNIQDFNDNSNIIDTKLKEVNTSLSDLTYQTAGGTATAITLTMQTLVDGYSKTFIASANNSGAATTINGKPLYKPGTTIAPNLVAGKAYNVWYNSASGCFFIKASAEGDAIAVNVLAGKKFSNDSDTGLTGTMTNNGAVTITPGTTNKVIPAGYHNGSGYVAGDADLISANIKAGANIFGVAGSSTVVDTADAVLDPAYLVQGYSGYDDGVKKVGTMVNQPYPVNASQMSNNGVGTLWLGMPLGAYLTTGGFGAGTACVQANDANFIAANIVSGKSIFGLAGTATVASLGGKTYTTGTVASDYMTSGSWYTSVTLPFTPTMVVARHTSENTLYFILNTPSIIGLGSAVGYNRLTTLNSGNYGAVYGANPTTVSGNYTMKLVGNILTFGFNNSASSYQYYAVS